jgi:hypothetical protein|tara:strand:+ start:788 stop:973 length:186 start_codon:yes stop_codon:yes gene_type:complete
MGSVADNFLRVFINRNEDDVAIDDIGYTLFVSYYWLALAVGRLFFVKWATQVESFDQPLIS